MPPPVRIWQKSSSAARVSSLEPATAPAGGEMSSASTVSAGDGAGDDDGDDRGPRGRRQQLAVHIAESGHTLEFVCDGSTAVEGIQRSVEELCGIPAEDQLLLCGNASLEPRRPLSSYNLPCAARDVFLFNKPSLHSASPPPPPESLTLPLPLPPPPPSPPGDLRQSLNQSPNPSLRALASYERKFRRHSDLAGSVYSSSAAKFELCARLLRERLVQERALAAARCNLSHTFEKLQQRHSEFANCFSQQRRRHSELLACFEKDLDRLRSVALHPGVQSPGRRCLIDLIEEAEVRKRAGACCDSHRRFEEMVSCLRLEFRKLKRRVEGLVVLMDSGGGGGGGKNLELLVKDHQKVLGNQRTIMQTLSKDADILKKLVDDFSSSHASTSFSAHDAVSAVGRMHDVHEKDHLPNMRDLDRKLSELLNKCQGKKNDMNLFVHTSMKKVKSVQSGIKEMMNELHAFRELMENQDAEFHSLILINGIGHAYRACLAEIVRRKSFLKLYMGLVGQMVERIAGERENEIRKRERFLKRWCKFIPHEIFQSMGLLGSPNHLAANLNPFDEYLLPIDIADVDRFAPQSQLGPSSKSTDSTFDLIKSEESSLRAGEKAGFRDILEGCDPLAITGTSRMEVENVRLKAELASAIAIICSFRAEIGSESVDAGQIGSKLLEGIKEATDEALRLKDEYADHLQSLLVKQQEQCSSYEKRIHELEQRLYSQARKPSTNNSASDSTFSAYKSNDCSLDGDEVNSTPDLMDPKLDDITEKNKRGEGGDENIANSLSALSLQSLNLTILEHPEYENQVGGVGKEATMNGSSDIPTDHFDMFSFGVNDQVALDSQPKDSLASDLQSALEEKPNPLEETENKLRAIRVEVNYLRRELEKSRNLLDESQTNCANMENRLHEAREEACIIKCAAERRAAEYDALRLSTLKVCTVFERLRGCVDVPGVTEFADSLQSLALSLSSSITKEEGDGDDEFHQCIKVLADKVGSLSQQNAELLDRSSRMEAAQGCQVRDLQEKKELIRLLYNKYQEEEKVRKLTRKQKISLGHLAVHDLAAFVRNSAGNYEAINRNCSKYFLSEESIALLAGKQSSCPLYIIGEVVHIERKIVEQLASPRPNLPVGCEYFVATVAALADSIHSNPS